MTILKQIVMSKYFPYLSMILKGLAFILFGIAFVMMMPAMDDFQVYSILIFLFCIGVVYYLYEREKDIHEKQVNEEYEEFLKENSEKIKRQEKD